MCTVEKTNSILVLFVKEHCWLFYDYYVANTKQIKQKTVIKWQHPFCGNKTSISQRKFNLITAKTNSKRIS